jgi:predicted Zn finger-like uncharacterized protein
MRLICPNCDAEYQVDDAAIPQAGRDVQCSNCGHAWFQLPADAQTARDAEDAVFGAGPDSAVPPAAPDMVPTPDPVERAIDVAPMPAVEPPRMPATRQTLAESVLSVLREEAARETAVRREEEPAAPPPGASGSMETQTEFGLDSALPPVATSAAQRHIARLKGPDADLMPDLMRDPVPEAGPKAAARRDLLPDIEEINSTLRPDTDRSDMETGTDDVQPSQRPRRRGFRSGFVLMMIVSVVLAMAYVMAPRIIAQIPGSAPAMRAYVAGVDHGRLWLDGVMKSASGAVRSFGGDTN